MTNSDCKWFNLQDRFDKWCSEGSSDFRFVSNNEILANGASPSKQKKTPRKSDDKTNDKTMELHENALGKLR